MPESHRSTAPAALSARRPLKLAWLWRAAFSAIVACTLFAGCGPPSDRLAVSGAVVLDGAPLDSGSIRFSSQSEGKLMSTGAMIQNGAYEIPQAKGLPPGVYHVEINAPDASAPTVTARGADGGPGLQVAPDRIPAEYNVESAKTIEVTADGDNRFDFTIETGAAK